MGGREGSEEEAAEERADDEGGALSVPLAVPGTMEMEWQDYNWSSDLDGEACVEKRLFGLNFWSFMLGRDFS